MKQAMIRKARGFLRQFKFEFENKDMEQDYRSLTEQNMIKDFKICLAFVMIFNLVSAVIALIGGSYAEAYISGGTVLVLVPIYCFRRYLTQYIQFSTLFIILSYDVSRLFLIRTYFDGTAKSRLFYSGYGIASLQIMLLFRLLKVSQKVFGVLILLFLRFWFLPVFVEPPFNTAMFIRHILVDFFMIYTFYNQEVVFRKIYQDFVYKKDELLKFKELLAESLPQSLMVVTYESNELLFSNKSFQNIFSTPKDPTLLKADLEALLIDQSSIRDAVSNNSTITFSTELERSITLGKALKKFSANHYLNDKAISLTASTTHKDIRRLFEITLKKVKWDNKDSIAVFFNDITYQENLIALKLANINKDKVIATVSHELRTPLNGIIGILNITEKRVEDPQTVRYLSLCKDNAYLLLSLVNSILDLHQISADKLKLNPAIINVKKVVSSIAQLFYFQCKEKKISLEHDVHKDVADCMYTDENRFKQVLINLVANAIKFTSKGSVKLQVTPHSKNLDSLQVSVTDTGIGIKAEDQKRLFKMYSKIEDGDSVNKNGVGLGLTISNALVIALNDGIEGRGIEVESDYGKGSKFSFEIQKNLRRKKKIQPIKKEVISEGKRPITVIPPESDTSRVPLAQNINTCEDQNTEGASEDNCQDDYMESFIPNDLHSKLACYASPKRYSNTVFQFSSKEPQIQETATEANALLEALKYQPKNHRPEAVLNPIERDLKILIVDDNPFNLLVAKNLIEEFECNVTTALGGQEAIHLVKKSHSDGPLFKIIFMDCQMPIMDGFETTQALKALMNSGEVPDIPIFGWTANNSKEDVKRCYEAGMKGHLPKPASKMDFLKVISCLR